MILNYEDLTPKERYKVMTQSVIPRPIAWIVTQEGGVVNLAPFSYFTPLSSNPPTLIVSIGQKSDGSPKDTLANIRSTKKATICFVNELNLEDMKLSAESLDKSISEVDKFNIETIHVLEGYPPAVKHSQSAMFCDFHQEVDLEGNTKPVILEIKHQYCGSEVCDDDLNMDLSNIARVGSHYATLEDLEES